jgi:hypothetical protein
MNLLIEHRVRLLEMQVDEETTPFRPGPSAVWMIVRDPGRRKLETIITALDKASFGCRQDESGSERNA